MSLPQLAIRPTGTRTHRRGQSSPSPRPRRAFPVPSGLVGMVVLVGLIECAVVRHPLDFSDPVSLSWQLAARDAQRKAPGCSVLAIGDSLVKHGVIPEVLERATGDRVWNLAVARGPAPATYFLLRRALDAGSRPRAVILDFKPSVLVGSPRYNLRYWQEILTPGECLDLVRHGGGTGLALPIALGRWLPSFRSRLELRGALLAALRGEDSPMRLINQVCRRNWRVNRGANVATHNPAFTGEVTSEQHKTLLSHVWHCHRANAHYIRRILDLTAERGIRVYWLLPPIAPELQARREQSGAEAGYEAFVQTLRKAYPQLAVVDARHANFGAEVFVDATHLDGRGARTLTVALGSTLKRDRAENPGGSRWIELPSSRAGNDWPEIVLEDVEQSRLVVKSGRGG